MVEDTGTEVSGLEASDLMVASFLWQDNTCDFYRKGLQTCRHGGRHGDDLSVRDPVGQAVDALSYFSHVTVLSVVAAW